MSRGPEDELVERLRRGDEGAWPELVAAVHPLVLAICRHRGYGRGGDDEDTSREVALLVLERLRQRAFAALRAYADSREKYGDGTSFSRWLGVVVHNAHVDHVRARPETHRTRSGGGRGLAQTDLALQPEMDPLAATEGGAELRGAEIIRVARLLEHGDFPPVGRQALLLWLTGHTPAEIARRLTLTDDDEARRVLHAARQRLRRLVRGGTRRGET